MSGSFKQRVLVEFNATDRDYPVDATLHGLFEAQVLQTPGAPAVVFGDEQLTYRQLDDRASALANHLRELGVHPSMPVGVCLERSLEMPVALLAVLKAGGGYVALDPQYPRDRLRVMLAEGGVSVLITTCTLAESLPDHHAQTVCMDSGPIGDRSPAGGDTICGVGPSDLAYVVYTSGSTGPPKGVMVSHRAATNRLFGMQEDYRLSPRDVVLQKTPYSFDVSVWEFFWTLMTGARMVIAKPGGHQDHDYLIDVIRSHQVTTLHFVPSVLDVFLQHPECTSCASIKRVFCGGEPLSIKTQRRFFEILDAELHHLYGPTEAAIDVTSWVCQRNSPLETVPIGRPVQNVRILILDSQMEPVPPGTAGELYVGGPQLAIGYLNRPDLTAERFIRDPFSPVPGAKLYRTGDLGRWRNDGVIEYLGRLDRQVKVRGVRIELEEIEAALGQHPSIRQCAVTAEGDGASRQLVAYSTTSIEAPLDSDLRAHLAERLPESMIPSKFVVLETMPFALNGKIDRAALTSARRRENEAERLVIAPRTDTEGRLAEIWQEVLGIPRIGINDNFFEMGGHSLRATVAIARMRACFGATVTLQDFFDRPTIDQLAAILDRQAAVGVEPPGQRAQTLAAGDPGPLHPVPRDGDLALSFAQERAWLVDQMVAGSACYNISWAVRLRGTLSEEALHRGLREVVRRHESLRTTVVTIADLPRAVLIGPDAFQMSVIDLRGVPESEREPEARRLAAAEARRPFDLSRDLMLRAQLVKFADHDRVLSLTMHHIAADGWSVGVFERELKALYEAFARDEPSPLPELPIQYADYAIWQRSWLKDEALQRQLAYWKRQLNGAPAVLELPTDFPRPAMTSHRGAQREILLGENLTAALRALGRREGATLFMTLLAGWQVLLSKYSGQDDISVGVPIAGRNRAELEGVIGFFVNTLVLRTDLSGGPTFRELLGRVRAVTLDAFAHQDLPFQKLVEELRPQRNLSHSPLFQVMFALQNVPSSPWELEGLTVGSLPLETTTAKYDLILVVDETASGLRCALEYNTELFEEATSTRLLGHFQVLLAEIAADPERRIGDLPLLTAEERETILIDWNQTATVYPRQSCVHELFEAQACRAPDAIAVVDGDDQITYRKLNARANQLAHYLRSLGVLADTRIALCFDRSAEMVVAMLGILKAGGVYVPLDPAQPGKRLKFLIEDSQALLLLTQSELLRSLPAIGVRAICVDRERSIIRQGLRVNLPCETSAESLAYVIYTSGSTGQPKGVMIPHRGIVRLVCGATYVPFTTPQRFLLLASPAFDASTFELWGALLHGSTCVVYSPRVPDFDDLDSTLKRHKITCLWLTSSLFNAIIDFRPETLAGLSHLLIGGEALSVGHVRRFREQFPTMHLVNGYGPTECTTFACTYSIPAEIVPSVASIPIGRPIANTRVYVLDQKRQPVPIGVPGELYLGGDGLATGYLNSPELTHETFLPDPFRREHGSRIYRTGDLVRWHGDGTLEFLGRLDEQKKLRGFRIELGEIEAALRAHPQVRQVVASLREDQPGEKRLVAYLVPADQESCPSASDLRDFLRERLPDYMIPATFVVLEALPLTPSGKLDCNALPAPDVSSLAAAAGCAAPRNGLEDQLSALWRSLLGIENVGIHTNFFLLGAHSLLVARFMAQARSQLSVDFTLRDVFESPTVAGLAEVVKQKRDNPVTVAPMSVGKDPAQKPHGSFSPDASNGAIEAAAGRLMPGGCEMDATYIKVIRQGTGEPPIVCVGDARVVPLILEWFPEQVPVLMLGLDGCHVWPPRYLTVEQQVASYVAALQSQTETTKGVLVGYSYGGLLAYRLASALLERGWQIEVNLVEPSFPGRYLGFRERLRGHLRRSRSWVRGVVWHTPGRLSAPARVMAFNGNEVTNADSRWNLMSSHYLKNAGRVRLVPLGRPIGLAGTYSYMSMYSRHWNSIEPGGVTLCILPSEEGHSNVFRDDNGIQWLRFLERSYNRLSADRQANAEVSR